MNFSVEIIDNLVFRIPNSGKSLPFTVAFEAKIRHLKIRHTHLNPVNHFFIHTKAMNDKI